MKMSEFPLTTIVKRLDLAHPRDARDPRDRELARRSEATRE